VYGWRLQAEQKMRKDKGKGMTDEQVVRFVDGCKAVSSHTRKEKTNELKQTTLHMNCTQKPCVTASSLTKADN
jgi:pantothenate kinase-related protein Tda10